MDDGNVKRSDAGAEIHEVARLVLTMDLKTFYLDVSGETPTLDFALGMLEQAKRHFEAQLRMAQAQKALAQPRAALPGELKAWRHARKE